MDYMSEGSNISVKDLPAHATSHGEFLKTASQFANRVVPSMDSPEDNFQIPNRHIPLSSSSSLRVDTTPRQHQSVVRSDSTTHSGTDDHRPLALPRFPAVNTCMWTASHAANCPTEDRSASLVNVLLQPIPPNFDSETQLPPLEPNYTTLLRLNLWSVIDGHGGGCVATYASEVLLPHIAASVSRALGCAIIDRGVCQVNGQLRDANALDLDGLIKTSDRSLYNPNSIHYRSPYERSDSEEEGQCDPNMSEVEDGGATVPQTVRERKQIASLVDANTSVTDRGLGTNDMINGNYESAGDSVLDAGTSSSMKTSVKTAASPANREALLGTHSPAEVAAITNAITESFLAVDEGWINSIDPVATHQTSCQSNGRWNSGACALVVFTIQRLDWVSVSAPDREKESHGPVNRKNTTQNRDAARRRMLDYATRTKSASSMSTASSTSSLTTEEAANASGLESEITETEGEDDGQSYVDLRKRLPSRNTSRRQDEESKEALITSPGGCSCHCYRAHDAILYTAHVGDCRAVVLGSAPPRTIKVRDSSHPDTTDDESSHHSSDETECLSSSDHDADSSEDEAVELEAGTTSTTTSTSGTTYLNFPRRVTKPRPSRRRPTHDTSGPFIALPPLEKDDNARFMEFDFQTDIGHREGRHAFKDPSDSSTSSQDSGDCVPMIHLPPATRPIDLTTDHSAYNPAEVTAVLRRCNNAPRAISAGVGGGIKRVAGSLAVTRALGDAYLKTPLLSFLPYKIHAPYISGRPEVNCRPLVKTGDKLLVLATDGVWERASGEDVLRWVRNFFEERFADAARRNNRRLNQCDLRFLSNEDGEIPLKSSQETAERDLFLKSPDSLSRKRDREPDQQGSPVPNTAKRRKRIRQSRINYNVADVIVRRVLNKVRRAKNISSLQALMSLPQGRARRSKHDDITASVVDLSAFIS